MRSVRARKYESLQVFDEVSKISLAFLVCAWYSHSRQVVPEASATMCEEPRLWRRRFLGKQNRALAAAQSEQITRLYKVLYIFNNTGWQIQFWRPLIALILTFVSLLCAVRKAVGTFGSLRTLMSVPWMLRMSHNLRMKADMQSDRAGILFWVTVCRQGIILRFLPLKIFG